MTHSLAGLLALNALFLVAGSGLLWGVRGWRAWSEWLRLAGVAYLIGVAVVGIAATVLLVLGVAPTVPVVVATGLVAGLGGLAVGMARRRPRPVVLSGGRPRAEPLLIVGAAAVALAMLMLAALFRQAYHQGLFAYDAWAFWTPKAESIYYFGGLDKELFTTLPGQTYPLMIPALQAMDFHFMGSVDTVTVAVQYWFLLAGFLLAVAGLLRPFVPVVYLWPFLGLSLVLPELDYKALHPQGDLPLDYFFVVAAVCLALWLRRPETWLLCGYGVFLSASMATKREGQLLAGCLVAAALLATWRRRRATWPWVLGVAVLAYLPSLPWRIWWSTHGLGGETPGASVSDLWHHVSRIPSSLWLVLRLLFTYDTWLVAAPLGLAAAVLLLLRPNRELAYLYLWTIGFAIAGFTWILWSISTLPIEPTDATPIPRAVGSLTLLSLALGPLMLARATRQDEAAPG